MLLESKRLQSNYVFIDGMRYYQFDDASQYPGVYPGVTTVLGKTKPVKDQMGLKRWRDAIGEQKAQEISTSAANRGRLLHSLIENYLYKSTLPDLSLVSTEVAEMWNNGLILLNDIKTRANLLGLEMPVYSKQYQYAGTFDCLVSVNKAVKLLDWKTSSKFKRFEWINDYCLQMAAYSQAIAEVYGERYRPESATIIIFLQEKSPQIFKLDKCQLLKYWKEFEYRLLDFNRFQ